MQFFFIFQKVINILCMTLYVCISAASVTVSECCVVAFVLNFSRIQKNNHIEKKSDCWFIRKMHSHFNLALFMFFLVLIRKSYSVFFLTNRNLSIPNNLNCHKNVKLFLYHFIRGKSEITLLNFFSFPSYSIYSMVTV